MEESQDFLLSRKTTKIYKDVKERKMKKTIFKIILLFVVMTLCLSTPVLAATNRPALISNGNVSLSSAYLVEGNVYSINGNIAFGTGAASACILDGNAVVSSAHEVTFFNQWNMPDFRGEAITDDTMEFYFESIVAPALPSGLPYVDSFNSNTITESFSTSELKLGGDYVIDTSASDIYIVANKFSFTWGTLNIIGNNKAYIFINEKVLCNGGTVINSNNNLYFVISNAIFQNFSNTTANLFVTGPNLDANGGGTLYGNVYLTNSDCLISGNHSIYGTVYAPETNLSMSGAATVYGTVIAKSFSNPGKCTIIYDEFYSSIPANSTQTSNNNNNSNDDNDNTSFTTRDPMSLSNDYAYILGKDDRTMGADMPMLRGEASSVLYRLLKQNGKLRGFTYSESSESLFSDLESRWDRSAIEFTTYLGIYDTSPEKIYVDSPIVRGEAFKLFAIALDMTDETNLSYDDYAAMLIDKGFVQGDENGNININNNITRAEYCKIYNLIIGRDEMSLIDIEGNEITPATYGFTDFDESDWYYEIMLKATSAYTNGKVDLSKRAIRNVIDDYEN